MTIGYIEDRIAKLEMEIQNLQEEHEALVEGVRYLRNEIAEQHTIEAEPIRHGGDGMRLIDADALREHMYHEAFETDSDLQKWDSGCWIRYQMFENILETEITVEAEPIRHGRWIDKAAEDCFRCSVCEEYTHMKMPRLLYHYCPNCGAKMDEVTK